MQPRPTVPFEHASGRRVVSSREPANVLRITTGPELRPEGDKRFLRWETSVPADSLLTYGRGDPFQHIIAKDPQFATEHACELPSLPFIEFCRFRIVSMDADGHVVTGVWGPGLGPRNALLADVRAAHPELCSSVPSPVAAWADYDEDGDLDVALGSSAAANASVKLLQSDGGTFKNVTTSACPALAGSSASWGDFNADGRLDLLTAGERLVLYRSAGPPRWTFEADSQAIPQAAGDGLREAAFVDLNGDGLPDILAVDAAGKPKVLVNGGPPAFAFQEAPLIGSADNVRVSMRHMLSADFTADGLTDIWYSGAGGVMLKNENGKLKVAAGTVPYLGSSAGDSPSTAAGDFDGDGDLDLYVPPHGKSAGGVLLLNDGLGGFRKAESTGELAAFSAPSVCAAAADLTGNGLPDLVIAPAAGRLKVFLNLGTGAFMDGTELCDFSPAESFVANGITFADLNGDSAPDLYVSTERGGIVLENRCLGAQRGDFITVRPSGRRGVSGALVCLQTAEGSRSIQACQTGSSPLNPPECTFGVRDLSEARIEVRFSDGTKKSVPWVRSGTSRTLVVDHGE